MLKHRVNGRCRYHNRWVRQRLFCINWSPATFHDFLQRTLSLHSTRIKKNNPTYLRWFSFVEPKIKCKRNRLVREVTSGWLIEPVTCVLISKILGYKPLIDHANGLVVGTHLEDQFVFRQLPQVIVQPSPPLKWEHPNLHIRPNFALGYWFKVWSICYRTKPRSSVLRAPIILYSQKIAASVLQLTRLLSLYSRHGQPQMLLGNSIAALSDFIPAKALSYQAATRLPLCPCLRLMCSVK